jgi:hypothetical protein
MNVREKIVYTFNKFYVEFLKDVKLQSPELKLRLKNTYKVVDKSSEDYIKFFSEAITPQIQNLDPVNEAIQDVMVFQSITFADILARIGEDNIIMTWNYIYILSALCMIFKLVDVEGGADEETNTLLFNKVVTAIGIIRGQGLEHASAVMDDILDDDIKVVLSKIVKVERVEGETSGADTTGGDDIMKMFAGLENSKICSLAKEITSEIDTSNVKLDTQEDIMKLMDFSSSNNILGNIIGKVSSKMQEKMSKGELKQEDLIGEAMNMMTMMGGGAQSFFNNPMMADLMKNMKKGKVSTRNDIVRKEGTRERLRKKLEERNPK